MKKKFSLVLSVVMLVIFAVSCASTSSSKSAISRGVPNWFEDTSVLYKEYGSDVLIGVGYAQGGGSTMFTDQRATMNARVNLSEEIKVLISSEKTKNSRAVSSKTEMTLDGVRVIRRYMSKDGEAYVAVMIVKEKVLNSGN